MTNGLVDKKRQKITPRKAPSQARSKEKVNQILLAAAQLLAADGLDKLTNNHIAKAAGISVGSLYQYFPNKQAIIYSLYQNWLTDLQAAMRGMMQRATEVNLATLLDELLFAIYGSDEGVGTDTKLERELVKAMNLYPELQEIDREHGVAMGQLIAEILRRAGLTFDDKTAQQIGLYIYSLDIARSDFLRLGGEAKQGTIWFRQALERVLEPYDFG